MEKGAELSVSCKCAIFIGANGENLFILVTEDGDEESNDVKGKSFAGGWENPGLGCSCIDDGESGSIVAERWLGVEHEVDMESGKWWW